MKFKSDKQRRKVMMMLQSNGFTNTSAKFICDKNPGVIKVFKQKGSKERVAMDITALDKSLKGLTAKQLNKKGVRLAPNKDTDKDGVKNSKDCRPLDKKRQGIIHDFIKKKNQWAKQREKKLEQKQDKLLRDIDNEKTKLAKTRIVQKNIMANKKLKQELSDLKKANFAQSTTGKIIAVTTSPKVKKAAKKFLNKIFK